MLEFLSDYLEESGLEGKIDVDAIASFAATFAPDETSPIASNGETNVASSISIFFLESVQKRKPAESPSLASHAAERRRGAERAQGRRAQGRSAAARLPPSSAKEA